MDLATKLTTLQRQLEHGVVDFKRLKGTGTIHPIINRLFEEMETALKKPRTLSHHNDVQANVGIQYSYLKTQNLSDEFVDEIELGLFLTKYYNEYEFRVNLTENHVSLEREGYRTPVIVRNLLRTPVVKKLKMAHLQKDELNRLFQEMISEHTIVFGEGKFEEGNNRGAVILAALKDKE